MAEALIRLEAKNSENGYVVTIQENGWQWGTRECLPTFGILKIPDATIAQMIYLAELVEQDGILKRRYQLNSATINRFGREGGIITTTWSQAQKFVNKVIS